MVNYNNYLTTEPIRKFPLRNTSLAAFRKICAVINNEPFEFNLRKLDRSASVYYLTDEGLNLLYDFTKAHDLTYMRSLLSILFIRATEYDIQHPETFSFYSNFRGTTGARRQSGILQKALIVRQVGKVERKYYYDSIKEAREQLKVWLRYYPIEQFTLYRVRPKYGREKIKLLTENKNNLENYNRSRK